MNKKQIIGAIVAAVLFIGIGVSSVLTNTLSKQLVPDIMEKELISETVITPPSEKYVGVVAVKGTIQEQTPAASIFSEVVGYQHTTTLEYIDDMINDSNNVGMLLEVDSPGGTIYESEELYLKIQEYKKATNRPVWTYMEHYAASGGYYISAPSDEIYANPNTTTGSIGVIMTGYDLSGLYEKLGIKEVSIVSGPNKNMSHMNEEQIAIYQATVNESFERFVEIVADGRGMTLEQVKTLADGRIYTAKQAKENGLIDEIGLYEEMQTAMKEQVGNVTFYEPKITNSVISQILSKAGELKPKSETEILTELTKEYGRGVPMYYAEQLR
ncbi:MAG: signal peptide peptidase SppA [Lachnospiraceae bacterium]